MSRQAVEIDEHYNHQSPRDAPQYRYLTPPASWSPDTEPAEQPSLPPIQPLLRKQHSTSTSRSNSVAHSLTSPEIIPFPTYTLPELQSGSQKIVTSPYETASQELNRTSQAVPALPRSSESDYRELRAVDRLYFEKDDTLSTTAITSAPEEATLVRARVPVKVESVLISTPQTLHAAAKQGDVQLARLLIGNGVEVDAVNDKQEAALFIAAKNGRAKMARLLLQSGADPNLLNKNNKSPLYAASARGDKNLVKLLLKKGAVIEENGESPLKAANQNNSSEKEVSQLLIKWLEKGKRQSKAKCLTCVRRNRDCDGHFSFPECQPCRRGGFVCERSIDPKKEKVESAEKTSSNSEPAGHSDEKVVETSDGTISPEHLSPEVSSISILEKIRHDTSNLPQELDGSQTVPVPRIERCEHAESESTESELEIDSSDFSGSDDTFDIISSDNSSFHRSCTSGNNQRKRKANQCLTRENIGSTGGFNNRNNDDDSDDVSESGGGRRKRPKRDASQGSESSESRPYACPYYKNDSDTYFACKMWSNQSVSRIKGHCLRTHLKPVQCQRCSNFRGGDNGQINKHLKEGNCEKAEYKPLDASIIRKGKDLARGKSKSWEEVYMVLFDCDRESVPSPYLGEDIDEVRLPQSQLIQSAISNTNDQLRGFMDYVRDQMPRLLSEYMASQSVQVSNGSILEADNSPAANHISGSSLGAVPQGFPHLNHRFPDAQDINTMQLFPGAASQQQLLPMGNSFGSSAAESVGEHVPGVTRDSETEDLGLLYSYTSWNEAT